MIYNTILENNLINRYNRMYDIFAQNNVLKLNLSNDNTIRGLIQDVKSDNANSTYKKEIITNYGVLKTGDYITHTYNGKSINYIVDSEIDREIGCDKAYLVECPFFVNIFDWNYSDILTYPIALKNNNASLGVSTTTISITANSSFDIILKYDIHTRSFIESDNLINGIKHAKIIRLLTDGTAFSVVGINHLISKGLLVISIENTNKTPNDNLELGVADYWTLYREPVEPIVDAEIAKYEDTALITKDVLAGADVTSKVMKLKAGMTVNPDVAVSITSVNVDGLLTLNAGVVTLTNQISFEATDNVSSITLSFTKDTITKTLTVIVTFEKQDEQTAPPPLTITGDTELCIGDTNDFSINTTEPVTWSITNVSNGVTLNTSGTSANCSVTCKNDTKLIGKTETLKAIVNGFEYTLVIYLSSWI